MSTPSITGSAPSTSDDLEAAAKRISVAASAMSVQIDAERQLPALLVSELIGSGLLRAGAPVEVGGPELDPASALRCAEEVARGNASAGWCVSIAITSSLLAGYLPERSRTELFGDGRGVGAGVWAPQGRARTVPGGVVISGRWPFCSGITHADVFFGGSLLDDQPTPVVVALSTTDLQVLDTWNTLGLRGTGSHDAVATEVFVPSDRVFSLADGPVIDRPLYRFPIFGFFAACIAAAAMGNARSAIDSFIELAATKSSGGSRRTLAERPTTLAALASAEASLESARALYYQAIDRAWLASQDGSVATVQDRARLRIASTHGVRTAADVVRSVYDLSGSSAIYDDSPLQRHFRDASTATAHFQVNAASRELPGRVLMGLPAEVGML